MTAFNPQKQSLFLTDNQQQYLQRYRAYMSDWHGFLEAMATPLAPAYWVNPLRSSVAAFHQQWQWSAADRQPLAFAANAFLCRASRRPGKSWPYLLGVIHIQELVSQLPVLALEVAPGQAVVDLCAAPGNKTAQIAAQMQGRGTIVAVERDPVRLASMRSGLCRLGVTNAALIVADGRLATLPEASYDRVLVDAPCSCEATFRRQPQALQSFVTPGKSFGNGVQVGLLRKALRLVKPGGLVVYATCTFRPEENEAVVAAALSTSHACLEPIAIPGAHWQPGLTAFAGASYGPELAHCARIWPQDMNSSGFFMARLRRLA